MRGAWAEVWHALGEPVTGLLDPSHRVFVPFLLGAGLIAVVLRMARGLSLTCALVGTLSPRVWAHPSALADYRLIAARALLRALTFGAWSVSLLAVAALSLSWLRLTLGLPGLRAPSLLVGALFTLTAFVAEDLARFLAHRLMHRVPALWAFHRVHHSAEVLTPFTLYRTHPVEGALNQAAGALTVGLVTGGLAWVFGPALRGWQLFGVDALGLLWVLAGANLRHSHVWLSYGPRVERWLLSPAQHQVHHSRDPAHADKNLGTALAVWDRLFGSLYVTTHHERLRFGLPEAEAPIPHTVPSMLLSPFATIFAQARRASVAPRAALLAAALLTATCSNEQRFDRVSLLQGLARCTIQVNDQFHTAAGALAAATAAYATTPGDTQRAAARAAWESAIDVWQRAEMHRYGPAGGFDVVAGMNLREQVYAWPDVNRCLIEQRIVSRGYEGTGFSQLPTSARGLATIEYLLFADGTDNACAPTEPINAMGTWAALGADEITRRRAAYARAAADDVLARAAALRASWAPNGFETQLVTAGQGSTVFRTQQDAFNALGNALTHVETDLRDLRVGRPLGVFNCTSGTCPDAVESRWAGRALSHVRNNLAGARMILEGCAAGENQGFDDRLQAAGAGALATRMRTLLNNVDVAVNAIPGDKLATALTSDQPAVQRLYDALKALTDFLKNEFATTLQITGSRLEGDND
jgi:sterol desaturase/sphingolipid hydroxylase (fatty acid hydroxylase superfamily)/predicted lipoprotein